MKRLLLFVMFAACFYACDFEQVRGNGNIASKEMQISRAERIFVGGSFDVEITQGATASVKIEADENLLDLVVVEDQDGKLVVKTKDGVGYSSSNPMTVYITTPRLEEFHLSGSGKVTGKSRFTEGEHLNLTVSGSGDMIFNVNTPELRSVISGSGNIKVSGETRTQSININGSGNYDGYALKSENSKVKINGGGDIRLFADMTLDVNIAGSGTVYYKGNPNITKSIAGSGDIRKAED